VHDSLTKAKEILKNNQYPPSLFEPLIQKTITSIVTDTKKTEAEESDEKKEEKMIFIQYRGKVSENFENLRRPVKSLSLFEK